jgi:TIR domain
MRRQETGRYEYDVCLSFAEEQRGYVKVVAEGLRSRGLRVFYDEYEKVRLWGKDLYEHLDWVYQQAAHYCVLFASADYARKIWTNHERRSAQARAVRQHDEYILPARFDETEIPGLRSSVGYLDLRTIAPDKLAELINDKILATRRGEEQAPDTGPGPPPSGAHVQWGAAASATRQEWALSDPTPSAHTGVGSPTRFARRPDASELAAETRSVLAELSGRRYPLWSSDIEPGQVPAAVQARLASYEKDVLPLAGSVARSVWEGGSGPDDAWLRTVSRLAGHRAQRARPAFDEFIAAQAYPALLASYAAGIALRATEREPLVLRMLSQSALGADGHHRSLAESLLLFRVASPPVVAAFPVWAGTPPKFGLSVWLRRVLSDVLTEFLADEEFAAAFEEYEYLRALLELDLLGHTALGEFAVAFGRGRSGVDARVAPVLAAGSPLLTAGAFRGDPAVAADLQRRLRASATGQSSR